jgi:cellulose biosynthesis protein BcsQ
VSRFFDAVRKADESRRHPRTGLRAPTDGATRREGRPHLVISVVSNKGGVGKTTVATNLAVYLRAMREDLPILLLGLDDQPSIDRMFEIEPRAGQPTIAEALRTGSLAPTIRLGQYGVHYSPTSARTCDLKREISETGYLDAVLADARWRGVVIVDTKSDLEILTQNALWASDLTLVLVRDQPSLVEARKVFDLLAEWKRPRESARILLSLIDLRIRYARGESRDVMSLLLSEIRSLGYPLFETFLSSSPKVESLHTNPAHLVQTILHGAPTSIVHRQMRLVAEEVLRIVAPAPALADATQPVAGSAPDAQAEGEAIACPQEPELRSLESARGVDVESWLGRTLGERA